MTMFRLLKCLCGGMMILGALDAVAYTRDGMIAEYDFSNNSALDTSGNGNHGLIHNAQAAEDRDGNSSSAMLFNGQDAWIEIPNNTLYNSLSNITISMWICPQRGPNGENRAGSLIGKQPSGFNTSFHTSFTSNHGGLFDFDLIYQDNALKLFFASQFDAGGTEGHIANMTSLEYDQWQHIAITVSRAENRVRFYVNGELVEDVIYSVYINIGHILSQVTNEPIRIGKRKDADFNPALYFTGCMDDIKIYDRALAADEIASLADHTTTTPGTGLLLWNRLGSTNEVNNSEVGPNGTLNAGRFIDGPFGKAIELNMQEQMGVTFPPQIVPGPNGCIEFWAKLSGFPEAIRQPGGAWPLLVGTSALNFGMAFCSNNGAASGGLVQGLPGLGTSGTGLYGYWTYASALKTNTVNDWHHYALVWSGAGIPGVDNGQRRVISYIDGRMNTGHWIGTTGTQFTGLTNVIFGLLAHQGVPTGSVAYDNIKIWNLAKTNFSDRFTENAGDLRRFLSIVEARGEAIPCNGEQMYAYGDTVNASVPETVTDGGVRYTCTGATVDGNQFTLEGTTNVTMTLTNNATLTWQWRTEYLLQVTTNGNGAVNDAAGWHEAGNAVQLTAVPAVGWAFDGWAGETNGCVMDGSVLTVAMTQPRTISASFALATALLTFSPQGGAVTPSTKSITFDNTYGDLPMAERPDYLFKGWWTGLNGQGMQILASSVVAIAGDHTLYANWEKIPLLCVPGNDTPLTTLGGYEGFLYSEGDFDGTSTIEVRGTVTMSVSRRNESVNITAKIRVQDKSLIFKSPVLTAADPEDVSRAVMTALGGEVLDLYVGQNRIWGTLSGGSLGVEVLIVDGMRNRFADRQDLEAQAILNTFRGYYTLALPAYGALSLGAADAAPEGTGYLTITVGNQGHVKISGVLADGTKFSTSSSLILFDGCGPEACVPLFVPLYAQKGWLSGLLWFDPVKRTIVTDRDLSWFLRWEKPGSGMDGFSELLEACGGFYSTLDALSTHYRFSAGANAVPYFYNGGFASIQSVFPSDINVAADGTRLVITKGVAPLLADGAYNYAASENSSMATLTFREATGIFSGNFKLYYDYTAQERFHHRAVTVQYSGVLVPRRSEVFADLPIGQGFYLVPDSNPAFAPLRLKRSYPIELDSKR